MAGDTHNQRANKRLTLQLAVIALGAFALGFALVPFYSVLCELTPTLDARAYVGTALGREIVYERSRSQVEADIDRHRSPTGDANR